MKWPLVWRSTMEREQERAKDNAASAARSLIGEERLRVADLMRSQDETHAVDLRARDVESAKLAAESKQYMDAYLQSQDRELAAFDKATAAEQKAADLVAKADAARIRADVRAQEWEAIARELIARGAGRPHPDAKERAENPIAKRIREESNGDPSLAAHFWKYVQELRNAGKKDEEIVGMIGWDVVNGAEQEPTK